MATKWSELIDEIQQLQTVAIDFSGNCKHRRATFTRKNYLLVVLVLAQIMVSMEEAGSYMSNQWWYDPSTLIFVTWPWFINIGYSEFNTMQSRFYIWYHTFWWLELLVSNCIFVWSIMQMILFWHSINQIRVSETPSKQREDTKPCLAKSVLLLWIPLCYCYIAHITSALSSWYWEYIGYI